MIAAKIHEVPLNKWSTIWSLAAQVGILLSAVFRFLKRKDIKAYSSAVKPFLTAPNMQTGIEFCSLHIYLQKYMFFKMNDMVHIDEKWDLPNRELKAILPYE